MRHDSGIKVILCVLMFAACALPDVVSDSAAIARAVTTLNEPLQRDTVIAEKGTAASELEALQKIHAQAFRIPSDVPSVTISHEPWGEATLSFPGPVPAISFITPDVALAEGACTSDEGQTTRLLFVMKKEGDAWKIASLRMLAR